MALYRAGQPTLNHRRRPRTDHVRLLHVESFNGRMRDALFNESMLRNLAHTPAVIAAWGQGYNTELPHSALDYRTSADNGRTLATAIADRSKQQLVSSRGWTEVQWQVMRHPIHTIHTGIDIRFVNQHRNGNQICSGKMHFDKIRDAHCIAHWQTKPCQPWTNGQVNR